MAEQKRNTRNTKSAKVQPVNLGLSITEKRPDGYHNLETVFYPVALEDALEIRTNPEAPRDMFVQMNLDRRQVKFLV